MGSVFTNPHITYNDIGLYDNADIDESYRYAWAVWLLQKMVNFVLKCDMSMWAKDYTLYGLWSIVQRLVQFFLISSKGMGRSWCNGEIGRLSILWNCMVHSDWEPGKEGVNAQSSKPGTPKFSSVRPIDKNKRKFCQEPKTMFDQDWGALISCEIPKEHCPRSCLVHTKLN